MSIKEADPHPIDNVDIESTLDSKEELSIDDLKRMMVDIANKVVKNQPKSTTKEEKKEKKEMVLTNPPKSNDKKLEKKDELGAARYNDCAALTVLMNIT